MAHSFLFQTGCESNEQPGERSVALSVDTRVVITCFKAKTHFGVIASKCRTRCRPLRQLITQRAAAMSYALRPLRCPCPALRKPCTTYGAALPEKLTDPKSVRLCMDQHADHPFSLSVSLCLCLSLSLFNLVSKHAVSHHAFADDNQLYKISTLDAIHQSIETLQNCTTAVKSWMTANKLQLNDKKKLKP